MPRKPDYKRDKKLREAAQRKRNEEAQLRKATRKSGNEGAPVVVDGTVTVQPG